MNIEQLRYIVEVAKTHSILSASEDLNITQSALSQSITKLEQELGLKIFNRSRAGTFPTEAGQRLIEKAMETLIKIDEFQMMSHEEAKQITGTLKIGTIPGSAMFLPKIIAQYKQVLPQIKINIHETDSQTIMNKVKRGSFDIGLIGLTKEGIERQERDIILKVILQGKIIAAANKNSKFALKKSISPQDLMNTPIVLYDDDRLKEFINLFAEKFGPLNIFFTTNNLDIIKSSILENKVLTIGPDYTVKHDPLVLWGDIVPLKIEDFPHDYPGMALVYQTKQQYAPIVQSFIQKLSETLFS